MHYKIILKILSKLLLILSLFILFPLVFAVYYHEYSEFLIFFAIFFILLFTSLALVQFFKMVSEDYLSVKDGFLLVFLSWLLMAMVGAIPYYFTGTIPSFVDAFFESVSGFTTTGASILTNIEILPKSVLLWRALTHWLGGMGIIVLTVAVLPLLGVGGLQLIKAELPGPTIDRLTPRIKDTAKILWTIYIIMTLLETILLLFGGLNFFEALTHSFSTLATGGFSTKNASIQSFNSTYIEVIITIFMVLAGINFTLYYRLIFFKLDKLLVNTELKAYLTIFFVSSIVLATDLYFHFYKDILQSVRYAFFQTATILTTTGFYSFDYEKWPYFSQSLLFLLMFVGGCSGSTAGGIKVIRLVALFRQAINELKYVIHPKGIFTLKINNISIKKDILYAISAFFFLYIIVVLVFAVIISAAGYDLKTSISSVAATLGNIGPGFGGVGPTKNYFFYPDYIKWLLSFTMILGRLELYAIFILLTPSFWKK
jgi:trk system potassium uptake protein TrkH